MRRLTVLILTITLFALAMAGCENADTTTAPDINTPEIQAVTAYESGGFDALMNLAADGQSSMSSDDIALKTSDPDTMWVAHSKPYGTQSGYWTVDIVTTVHPSGDARGYHLPFTVSTSDPNGWTYVGASLGSVYSSEPGTPWGYAGISGSTPYSDHVKLGASYPTWTTDGQYAVHTVRCNTLFLLRAPSFTVSWDEDNVEVRDVNNDPITDYVLID